MGGREGCPHKVKKDELKTLMPKKKKSSFIFVIKVTN